MTAMLLVGGTSAFKPALVPNYGKDVNDDWHSLSGLTRVSPLTQPSEGEYRCLSSQDICTAEFDYANPANNADDYIAEGDPGTVEIGQ